MVEENNQLINYADSRKDYEMDGALLGGNSSHNEATTVYFASPDELAQQKQSPNNRWGRLMMRVVRGLLPSSSNNNNNTIDRPDNLEYDFVARSEKERRQIPHRFDEKTVSRVGSTRPSG